MTKAPGRAAILPIAEFYAWLGGIALLSGPGLSETCQISN